MQAFRRYNCKSEKRQRDAAPGPAFGKLFCRESFINGGVNKHSPIKHSSVTLHPIPPLENSFVVKASSTTGATKRDFLLRK